MIGDQIAPECGSFNFNRSARRAARFPCADTRGPLGTAVKRVSLRGHVSRFELMRRHLD